MIEVIDKIKRYVTFVFDVRIFCIVFILFCLFKVFIESPVDALFRYIFDNRVVEVFIVPSDRFDHNLISDFKLKHESLVPETPFSYRDLNTIWYYYTDYVVVLFNHDKGSIYKDHGMDYIFSIKLREK
tara:strand:- start:682 stop:1065 length:384 start_codon:yes stop_codon:yes gene_type:complete